ncbi:protein FAM184A isoform X7 [Rhinoraja longicauda]
MATGVGWQQQQHYSGGPPAGKVGSAPEYNQELHIKMSKKIAQLTKVIYALNTKNDEHEAAIQALKEAHEEDIQQIFDETKEKILYYKEKINEEVEFRKKIQLLEESLEQHEQMKKQALAAFDAYKQQVEDTHLVLETQQMQGVVIMSRNIQEIKDSFEDKLQEFMRLESQFDLDKQETLEELRAAHKLELQNLLKSSQSQKETSDKQQEKLQQMLRTELISVKNKTEALALEKQKIVDEFEVKLSKTRAFYEHEIEAIKKSQQVSESVQCKQRESQLKMEFHVQETALRTALEKLQAELQISQEDGNQLRNKYEQLHEALNKAESHVQMLQEQLKEDQQKDNDTLINQKQLENELVVCKDLIQQQSTELQLKSSHIGTLQATQMTQEATIQELESQHCRLKEKLSHLEEERNILQNGKQTLDEQQRQQVMAIEKSLNEEKEMQMQYYEEEITNLHHKHEGETKYLKETFKKNMEESSEKHEAALESVQVTSEREKQKLQMEIDQSLEKDRMRMEEEKSQYQRQIENVQEELTAKLNTANQEVCRLQELVKKNEHGLGSAEGNISSLKDAQKNLKEELDYTRVKLRETSDSFSSLRGEMEQQKQNYETQLTLAKEDESFKLEKLEEDLEQKWKIVVREQYENLCTKLERQHADEKRSALVHLSHQKDQEMNVEKEDFQKKVEDLLNQISLLKQSLEMQLSQSQDSLQKLQCQCNHERQRLMKQMQEMEEEHKRQQASLENAHQNALRNMMESKNQEYKKLEDSLIRQHKEKLEAQKDGQRIHLEALQKEAEEQMQDLRTELEDERKVLLAASCSDLNYKHSVAMDQLNQNHQLEIEAARMELDRAIDLRRQEKKELLSRISDLQEEVRHREHHIKEMDEENRSMHENLSTLTKELEYKGNEVLKVRSDVNQKIRLEEAEEKYNSRESRAEDLQLINELKEMITERDQLMKKLMDEKKYYQLELVNRETNFNKVFNASPTVGVINPLAKQKKKNDKIASRFVSAPNLSALESAGMGNGQQQHNRLEPIPNSPVHDIGFNSNKPLPQTVPPKEVKRFLSPSHTETTPVTESSSSPQHEEWFARYFTF